jgi:hypothetical protein
MIKYTVKVNNTDGTKFWYLNDKLHREDGPAVEYANGTKRWFLNDKLHREDGPAVEHSDGTKFWYLNDKELTEREFIERTSTREMTLEQICKELGYNVKVVR